MPKEMTPEEVVELSSLFDEFKGDKDIINLILGRLSVPRSRKEVLNKLCELGLVYVEKKLRKKKKKKENVKETNLLLEERVSQLSSNYGNDDMIIPGPSSYKEEEENIRKRNTMTSESINKNKRLRVFDPESESETDIEENRPTQKSIHGLKQKKGRISSELMDTHADHTSNKLADDTALLSQEDIFSISGSSKATLSQKTIILSSQESCSDDDDVKEIPTPSQESFFNKNSLTKKSNKITHSDRSDYSQKNKLSQETITLSSQESCSDDDDVKEIPAPSQEIVVNKNSLTAASNKITHSDSSDYSQKNKLSQETITLSSQESCSDDDDVKEIPAPSQEIVVNKNSLTAASNKITHSDSSDYSQKNKLSHETITLSSQESCSDDDDVKEIPAPSQESFFNKNSLTTESNKKTHSDSYDYSQNKTNLNLENSSFVVNKDKRLRVFDSESESESDIEQNRPTQKSFYELKWKKVRISSELNNNHADHTSNRLADDIVIRSHQEIISNNGSSKATSNLPQETIILSSQESCSDDDDVIEIPAPYHESRSNNRDEEDAVASSQENYCNSGSFDNNSTSSQETITPPSI